MLLCQGAWMVAEGGEQEQQAVHAALDAAIHMLQVIAVVFCLLCSVCAELG